MKLLLDEMISNRVAERLNDRGGDAVAVTAEEGLRGLPDGELLAAAQAGDRALITYNVDDFHALLHEWAEAERSHRGVVFVSNTTIPPGDLVRLTNAIDRFTTGFKPWPSFSHWLTEAG